MAECFIGGVGGAKIVSGKVTTPSTQDYLQVELGGTPSALIISSEMTNWNYYNSTIVMAGYAVGTTKQLLTEGGSPSSSLLVNVTLTATGFKVMGDGSSARGKILNYVAVM